MEVSMRQHLKALVVDGFIELPAEPFRFAGLRAVLDEAKLVKGEELHVVPDVLLHLSPNGLIKDLNFLTQPEDELREDIIVEL